MLGHIHSHPGLCVACGPRVEHPYYEIYPLIHSIPLTLFNATLHWLIVPKSHRLLCYSLNRSNVVQLGVSTLPLSSIRNAHSPDTHVDHFLSSFMSHIQCYLIRVVIPDHQG